MSQVSQMIDVKEEMQRLVEENYKLKVKEIEENFKLKIKEISMSQRSEFERMQRDKEAEIQRLEREVSDSRKRQESNGWGPGEKERVLEDFNYLKKLYEKDREKMGNLLVDTMKMQVRSPPMQESPRSFSPVSSPQIPLEAAVASNLQKRNSIILDMNMSSRSIPPRNLSRGPG